MYNARDAGPPVILGSKLFYDQKKFMEGGGQTTEAFNIEQMLLYVKLTDEEFNEELLPAVREFQNLLMRSVPIHQAVIAEIIDGAADTIVTAAGILFSLGVNPSDVMNVIWQSNLAKLGADGKVIKNEVGKIQKPSGWEPPNLIPFAQQVLGTTGGAE